MKCDADHYEDAPCAQDVVPVNVVMPGGHDWGVFWYCSGAIRQDEERGFLVTRLTLDQAAAMEDKERRQYRAWVEANKAREEKP